MRFTLKACLIAGLAVGTCQLVGCGSGSLAAAPERSLTWSQTALPDEGPPKDVTPIDTAYAWFRAANARDCNLYQSFLQRPDLNCQNETPPSEWQTVTNVKCAAEPFSTPKREELSDASHL
jgi:hypothetical protein